MPPTTDPALLDQFMQMAGPPAAMGGALPPQIDGPSQIEGPPVPPEMQNPEAPEDVQLETGVIELEPGLRVARSIAPKVIELENYCGVRCVDGYRDAHTNKMQKGTVKHSFHQMTEDGHGAADFEGTPRQLQKAMVHAKRTGAIEADVHNDGRGQLLHVAW